MRKYELVKYILDKFASDISEKIWLYLIPINNNNNIFYPKPKIQYHKFFNHITNDFEDLYISYNYKNMLIHRCANCSHIKYLNYKNKYHNTIDCNCINITKNFWD